MIKHSRQREAIKAYLYSTNSHPTADQIYLHVRQEFPNISLGTVYRNLSLLVSLGEIRKLTFDPDTDHFDANTAPHCHVLCTCCKKIEDIDCALPGTLDTAAQRGYSGTIHGHSVFFYGLCPDCSEKEENGFF